MSPSPRKPRRSTPRFDLDGIKAAHGSESATTTTTDGSPSVARSAMQYRYAGREYVPKYDPRCHVCNPDDRSDDWRTRIENAIAAGWSARYISNSLPEGVDISAQSILNHIRKHLPLEGTYRRIALEERNKELGRLEEDFEGSLVDHIAIFKAVEQEGYRRMVNGEIQVEMEDMLNAAKMMATLQVDAVQQADADLFRQAIARMMDMLEARYPEDEFSDLVSAFQNDAVLLGIDARRRAAREQAAAAIEAAKG